ncbi:hypothetical protein G4P69_38915, partial [Aetokthonos hydrillicola CCALA 1050]|nr:hypothetical protein [Aetokthonos hydrillicola CCALA 1050]
ATSERKELENKAKQARSSETLDELKASYDRFKQDGGINLGVYYRLKKVV